MRVFPVASMATLLVALKSVGITTPALTPAAPLWMCKPVAVTALENFVEMRDKVADPRFLFRKQVELALGAKYPGRFVPKYAMVTFHRLPYAVALARGRVQDRMLGELCDHITRVEDLDWTKAAALVERELTPLGELQHA